MANTKAWLTKRVKIDGKWKVKQSFYNRSGSLSDKVLVDSERRQVPGVFEANRWHGDFHSGLAVAIWRIQITFLTAETPRMSIGQSPRALLGRAED
jgi:hypothetical protein